MELKQLRQFDVLAQEMHFGRAAQRLFISQPALTASIQRLEDEFGVRLFDRDTRTVRITPVGELMVRYAREVLHQAERTHGLSRALAEGRAGRIEIGFSGILFNPGLDELILRFRQDHPEIEVFLREVTSQKQIELLEAGRLDGCLLSLPQPPQDMEHMALLEDGFVACLPESHRLASRRVIRASDLRDEPFVFQARHRAPLIYDQLMGYCAQAGFVPRIVCESDHALSAARLVARGLGVSLLPNSLKDAGLAGLVFVQVESPPPNRRWYFAWKDQRRPPGLDVLIERMRGFAQRPRRRQR
jgi:DNA-binding transcriptional LysR family regulator